MKAPPWLLLCLSLLATPALGLKDGDWVYVQARNTKLLAAARADAEVKAVMRVGDALLWRKKEAGGFHRVTVLGRKEDFFVHGSNLTVKRPQDERWTSTGTTVDTQAFASSGAATKGLSEGAFQLAVGNVQLEAAAKDLLALEALHRTLDDAAVDHHLQTVGLAVESTP